MRVTEWSGDASLATDRTTPHLQPTQNLFNAYLELLVTS
jgi:hypothetical protein